MQRTLVEAKQAACPCWKTLLPVLVPVVGMLKCKVKGCIKCGDGPGGWVLPESALADCKGKLMIDAKKAFVRLKRGKGVRDAASAGFGWLCMEAVPPSLANVCLKLYVST